MATISTQNEVIGCFNEYDRLRRVILCEPQFMTIRDTINDTQKHFKDEGIHIATAMEQHKQFVKTLRDQQVDVTLLPSHQDFPEQVFTRDIGFTLGHIIFVAQMAADIRQGEENILKSWLEQQANSYYNLIGDKIEGGDVIIDRNTIYIGMSNRTNEKAIQHLRGLLPQFEILEVPFTEKYLHLDCVFNVISPKEALIYPGALKPEQIDFFASRYELIEVSEDEQFTLGTNVLSIGNNKIISLPVNVNVNKDLIARGFEVIEVDIQEIIKSGGSFRCCTLPLLRDNDE